MKYKFLLAFAFLFLVLPLTSAVTNITTCQDLNVSSETYNLQNSVTASGTCFNVENDSITVDCQGYAITLDDNGEIAFDVEGYDNLVLNNCNLVSTAGAVYGIRGGVSSNSEGYTISNSTIDFNSTSTSWVMWNDYGTGDYLVEDSTIYLNNAYLIYGYVSPTCSGCQNAMLHRNNITFNSHKVTHVEDRNWGYSEFINNSIVATSDNLIALYGGTPNCAFGRDVIIGNYIYSRTAYNQCHNGAEINYIQDNVFDGSPATSPAPLITSEGGSLYGFVRYSNSWINNTLINASGNWISNYDSKSGTETFTNTTFITQYGEVFFPSLTYDNSDAGITQAILNITDNNVFVDSSTYSGLNVSATITLNNPDQATGNYPIVDFGSGFDYCPVGICTLIDGGTPTIFNVAHFTDYSTLYLPTCSILTPSNYTVSGGNIIADDSSEYLGIDVDVSYDYDYIMGSQAGDVIEATTTSIAGTTNWFPIIITITAMIVLIILTVLIIQAIRGGGLIASA